MVAVCLSTPAVADEIDEQLRVINRAGPMGAGSAPAREAAQQLSARGVEILPRLLTAMDSENVVAANWYRTAYETITRRELAKPSPKFPVKKLRQYVGEAQHRGRPRRLVLALLDQLDPTFRDTFIPTRLDDTEFRNDAVSHLLKSGDAAKESKQAEQTRMLYMRAFLAARESGQIQTAAGKLRSIGKEVSIIDHMGFVIDWYMLGPFDAPGKSGFDTSFPPESGIDLKAVYPGQGNRDIAWKRYKTEDRMGQINLIKVIAATTEAVGYAYTEIKSPRDQTIQVRCGADDNLSVWVNGKSVFARRQWLNGTRLDRFTAPVQLRRGKNRVLVKICQGPQHKNPSVPNNWSMQLRFCDKSGAAVGLHSALPAETTPTTTSQ